MEEVDNDERWKDLPKIIKGMAVDKLIHKAFRAAILQPETASDELIKRSDGRLLNEIRELECFIDPLPNTHGSSYFKRGDTHVISSVTLASANDAKESYPTNGSGNIRKDYFFLHYDFPPYSTGEVSALQTTNRRMVGHGALAEKALKYVMPKFENFPYTVRVVSECVSSNGSSSMASACAGTLSLKAAGVPIANDVAGISVGLITDDAFSEANANDDELLKQKTSYRLLTDILGSEDHHGDMDFKIAGSKEGITAIQLDVKLPGGVPLPILFEAIDKSKTARMEILKKLEGATTLTSRSTVPKKLPKAALITVDPDRMGHIIGVHGGIIDTIKKFYDITVEQLKDTTDMIYIYGEEGKYVDEAEELIADIGVMVRPDTMFEKAVVLDVRDYGLLVKLNRSSTGLLHIGELSHDRELINKPLNTLLKKGHVLPVKVLTVDKFTGLVTLTRKGLYETPTEANYSDVDLLNISASEPTIIEEKSGPDIKPPKAFDKNFFK
jgi:polyribonucleotide nucleotidyltransferase